MMSIGNGVIMGKRKSGSMGRESVMSSDTQRSSVVGSYKGGRALIDKCEL